MEKPLLYPTSTSSLLGSKPSQQLQNPFLQQGHSTLSSPTIAGSNNCASRSTNTTSSLLVGGSFGSNYSSSTIPSTTQPSTMSGLKLTSTTLCSPPSLTTSNPLLGPSRPQGGVPSNLTTTPATTTSSTLLHHSKGNGTVNPTLKSNLSLASDLSSPSTLSFLSSSSTNKALLSSPSTQSSLLVTKSTPLVNQGLSAPLHGGPSHLVSHVLVSQNLRSEKLLGNTTASLHLSPTISLHNTNSLTSSSVSSFSHSSLHMPMMRGGIGSGPKQAAKEIVVSMEEELAKLIFSEDFSGMPEYKFVPFELPTHESDPFAECFEGGDSLHNEEQIYLDDLKISFMNELAASLIGGSNFHSRSDKTRRSLSNSALEILSRDGEFLLKAALYTRQHLNIRTTANFLLALTAKYPESRMYLRKYFNASIQIPSDWIEVAEIFQTLYDGSLQLGSLPSSLRKAMISKFKAFDEYQLGKYNKEKKNPNKISLPKIVLDRENSLESETEEMIEKLSFSLKQLVRKLHLTDPVYHVMCLLGKRYPSSAEDFYRSRLPGVFDAKLAGKRMKLKTPETWETQVSLKGNRASTWESLLDNRKLPFMAMLRNLRNLIKANVGNKYHTMVLRKLTEEGSIINSRQFPFRFFSAYEVLAEIETDDDPAHEVPDLLGGGRGRGRGGRGGPRGRGDRGASSSSSRGRGTSSAPTRDVAPRGRGRGGKPGRGDKAGRGGRGGKRKVEEKETFVPPKSLVEQYRLALDEAVKIATNFNVDPIPGYSILLCDVSDAMRVPCASARGLGKPREILEVALLLGFMFKYSCEDCQVVVYSDKLAPKTIDVEEGTILNNLERVLVDLNIWLGKACKVCGCEYSGDWGARCDCVSCAGTGCIQEKVSSLSSAGFPIDYLNTYITRRARVDNVIYLSNDGGNPPGLADFLVKYRRLVNSQLLFVNVNLGSKSSAISKPLDNSETHENDVYIAGYSDSILRFIADRGEGNGLLKFVENIDKKYKLVDEKVDGAEEPDTHDKKQEKKKRIRALLADSADAEPSSSPAMTVPLPAHLPGLPRTARVFISSTFMDMHGERDLLTRFVFPELRRRAKHFNVEVVEIDLRWGITEAEVQNSKQISLCLDEIASCNFFVGLLGERYGWVPASYSTPKEPRFDWLQNFPLGRSITELEMQYAALTDPNAVKGRAFFFFRNPEFLDCVPDEFFSVFETSSDDHAAKLEDLKLRLRCASHPCVGYNATWGGVVGSKPIAGGLEKFGVAVLDSLWTAISHEFVEKQSHSKKYKDLADESGPLSTDVLRSTSHMSSHSAHSVGSVPTLASQKSIPESHLDGLLREDLLPAGHSSAVAHLESLHLRYSKEVHSEFVGRESVLREINRFVESYDHGLFYLHGPPGSGKTALMSSFVEQHCAKAGSTAGMFVHFVGSVPNSSDIGQVLYRFSVELIKRFSLKLKVPMATSDLKKLFPEILALSAASAPGGKFLVVLDSLDQLSEADQGRSLDWLPAVIPPRVLILASTNGGVTLNALRTKAKAVELALTPLTGYDKTKIVRKVLGKYRKKLDETGFNNHMSMLTSKKGAFAPLYLKLACEELRVFGEFEQLSTFLSSISETLEGLLQNILARLESDHGRNVLYLILSLALFSRSGISESDLDAIFHIQKFKITSVTMCGVFLSLKPFLSVAASDGAIRLFHQEFSLAVRTRYFAGGRNEELSIHRMLIQFYEKIGDPEKSGLWGSCSDSRVFSDLPFHYYYVGEWAKLKALLTSVSFLEGKFRCGLSYAALQDYYESAYPSVDKGHDKELVRLLSLPEVVEYRSFVSRNAHILSAKPFLALQQALNEPDHSAPSKTALLFISKYKNSAMMTGLPIISWMNKPQSESSCALTLAGFTDWISCVAVSSSGDTMLYGMANGTIRCCTLPTCTELFSIKAHNNKVTQLAFVGANLFLSSSHDNVVSLWELSNGHLLKAFTGHIRKISCCAADPAGQTVVSGSWDSSLKVYAVKNGGSETCTLKRSKKPINSVAFHPEGQFVAAGHWDGVVYIWDTFNQKLMGQLVGHTKSVTSLSYSPCGKQIATCSLDGTVRLWSSGTFAELGTFTAHAQVVNQCLFSPNGKFLATVSADRKLKVWSSFLGTSALQIPRSDELGAITCLEVSPSDVMPLIAVGYHELKVAILSAATGLPVAPLLVGYTRAPSVVTWSKSGKLLASSSSHGVIFVHTTEGSLRYQYTHSDGVNGLAFNPSNELQVAVASENFNISIITLASKPSVTRELKGHMNGVLQVKFNPAGSKLYSSSRDGMVCEWEVSRGNLLRKLIAHGDWINGIALSLDGMYLATASNDFKAKFISLDTFQETATCIGHSAGVLGVRFVGSTNHIATCSTDGTSRVWRPDGSEITSLLGSGHRVNAIDVMSSEECSVIVAGLDDGKIQCTDPYSPAELQSHIGHADNVLSVAFRDDEVITSSLDATVKFWYHGKSSLSVSHSTEVSCVGTSSDGLHIATGDRKGFIKIWSPASLDHTHSTSSRSQPSSSFFAVKISFKAHKLGVNAIAITPATTFLTVSDDKTCLHFDLNGLMIGQYLHSHPLTSVLLTPKGNVIVGGWNGSILSLSSKTMTRSSTVSEPDVAQSWVHSLILSSPSSALAIDLNGLGRTITSTKDDFQTAKMTTLPPLMGIFGPALKQAWVTCAVRLPSSSSSSSHDLSSILVGDSNGNLVLGGEGKQAHPFSQACHHAAVTCVLYSQERELIISAARDGSVKCWKLRRVKMAENFLTQMNEFVCEGPCTALGVLPDGAIVAGDALGAIYFLSKTLPTVSH